MNTLTRVGAFAATLVTLTAGAAGLGAAVGPVASRPSGGDHAGHGETSHGTSPHDVDQDAAHEVAGLQVTESGYTLQLRQDTYRRPGAARLQFRILDQRGEAVRSFETLHGKPLHLIVVRRDLSSFEHVHPTMADDGTWSADVDLERAGEYRVFADFQPADAESGLTLGHDLSVQGDYVPAGLPRPSATSRVGDYEVRLDGELVPGKTSPVTMTVSRAGRPVRDLQPYLEAFGHLVALRDGDLAYLHVHPDGAPGDGRTPPGPDITFFAEVPSAGAYRLFLDFKHGGEVHTAAFTAHAGTQAASPDAPSTEVDSTEHSEHAH